MREPKLLDNLYRDISRQRVNNYLNKANERSNFTFGSNSIVNKKAPNSLKEKIRQL